MDIKNIYDKIVKIIEGDEKQSQLLEEIKKELEIEILLNGKKANKGIKAAFKRLQKENDYREAFKSVLICNDETFSITNGYFLVNYKKEQLPKELEPYINYKAEKSNFTYDYFLNTGTERELVSLNYDFLMKYNKHLKLNKLRSMYVFENDFSFNIDYLIDILTFLGYKDMKNIKMLVPKTDRKSPLLIESENGNAILLPIYNADRNKTEEALKMQHNFANEYLQ